MADENQNYLDMSDDDVMGMSAPNPEPKVVEVIEPVVVEEPVVIEPEVIEPAVVVEEPEVVVVEEPVEVNPLEQADGTETKPAAKAPVVKDPLVPATEAKPPEAKPKENVEPVVPVVEAKVPTPADHADLYDRLLGKPIKANGKEIQLKTPDEVEQAVKMGLNYTKKMQAIQPHLRVVKMLENNNLLDEAQLSYLIDLSQKKPEAIQKLLADSQFDPHTVDADKAESYVPTNHQVSDLEMQFQSALDEVEASETGPELIFEVSKQWDAGSRQALFQDPRLLIEINKQKANGLYARISPEVERRRALGEMQGVSFLAAYEKVGQEMHAAGQLFQQPQPEVEPQKQPEVITRVVKPPPVVANNDKAKAASSTKVTPATVKTEINYLGQSDEDFLKTMQGRV